MLKKLIIVPILFLLISVNEARALPMDFKGILGFETALLDNWRRTDDATDTSGPGSQTITNADGDDQDAAFQDYKFKLMPSIIVNDSATIKAEVTSGYGYGGRLGDSSKQTFNDRFSNAVYMYNTAATESNLALTQLNLNLYSDAGTYIIGRQSTHWGLGVVYNEGKNLWDRHVTIRDGIAIKYKISNFYITPYYYKIDLGTSQSGDNGTGLTKNNNAKEIGIELLYDNPERDLTFGLVFGQKESKGSNEFFTTDINDNDSNGDNTRTINETKVKVIDLYFKKAFGKFSVAVEAPILSGDMGEVYEVGTDSSYKASAIIAETAYRFSDNLILELNGGRITGDDGNSDEYKAMFLHPNYQIANLMFRYNLNAIANPESNNLYDSYISNATFAKLNLKYYINKWEWDFGLVWAKAEETAMTGETFYNHSTNEVIDSTVAIADQEDDYGFELDISFNYKWNDNVNIGGDLGYFFVGDYYAFNNTAEPQGVDNSYLLALKAIVAF